MRIIDTKQIYERRQRLEKKRLRVRRGFVLLSVIVLLIGSGYISYQRPLPEAAAYNIGNFDTAAKKPVLSWPAYGQAAVGAKQYGILDSNGSQTPFPTASVAKVMTALAVLRQKPLAKSQSGPIITIGDEDIAYYDYYASHNGSLVYVVNGEGISEYQALQAMLLPSANNMAETLARWAFGSLTAYETYANNLALELGMAKTHIADASGFSAETVSTANDLVRLGIAAMQEPALAEIVRQKSATIPVVGVIENTNIQLGKSELVGIKTGNTDEAGGCYLFASEHNFVNGESVTVVGAIMAAPSLGAAMRDTLPLLASTYAGFENVVVARKDQVVGNYKFAWGATNQAVVGSDISVFSWRGGGTNATVSIEPLSYTIAKSSGIGTINATSKIDQKSVQVVIKNNNQRPGLFWRVLRY